MTNGFVQEKNVSIFAPLKGPDGEIGRHATLRGWCRLRCASSSLVLGTQKAFQEYSWKAFSFTLFQMTDSEEQGTFHSTAFTTRHSLHSIHYTAFAPPKTRFCAQKCHFSNTEFPKTEFCTKNTSFHAQNSTAQCAPFLLNIYYLGTKPEEQAFRLSLHSGSEPPAFALAGGGATLPNMCM